MDIKGTRLYMCSWLGLLIGWQAVKVYSALVNNADESELIAAVRGHDTGTLIIDVRIFIHIQCVSD